MSARLIGNGSNLLRRVGCPVRTPIRITLQPDERAYYSVAGSYNANNLPAGGFVVAGITREAVQTAGRTMIGAYLNPSNARQIWRSVATSHDPESIWYQGMYATSADTSSAAVQSAEAFMQLGAYHFTIPEGLAQLQLTGVRVKYTLGGGALAYQSAAIRSANNQQLRGQGDFAEWYVPFAVVQQLGTPREIAAAPYDASVDWVPTGEYKGVRDFWGFNSATRDGGIPMLTTPVQAQYDMGQYTLTAFDAARSCWIVPYFDAGIDSSSYYPWMEPANPGYWACASAWGVSIEVELS